MALGNFLLVVAVVVAVAQLFGVWVVLAVAVHLLVMDYLLLQSQERQIQVAVAVREQAM
jgi:hypothetical protein